MQVLLLPESDSVVKKFVASEAVQRRVRFSTLSDVTDVEYVLDGYLVHAVVIAGQGYAAALALTKEICKRHANLSVIVAGKFDATEVSGLLFAGADDVVAPTVTPEYLCERIVCCCRRRQGRCQPIIEINDLVYNEQTSVATYGGTGTQCYRQCEVNFVSANDVLSKGSSH